MVSFTCMAGKNGKHYLALSHGAIQTCARHRCHLRQLPPIPTFHPKSLLLVLCQAAISPCDWHRGALILVLSSYAVKILIITHDIKGGDGRGRWIRIQEAQKGLFNPYAAFCFFALSPCPLNFQGMSQVVSLKGRQRLQERDGWWGWESEEWDIRELWLRAVPFLLSHSRLSITAPSLTLMPFVVPIMIHTHSVSWPVSLPACQAPEDCQE